MSELERLQKMLPENIQIGFVELYFNGDNISVLIRGSWIAPIRNLHGIVFDAAIVCFNLFTHTVENRRSWQVGGAFETSFDLVSTKHERR